MEARKSIALIFHDRDLTSDGVVIALSHDSRIQKQTITLWEIQQLENL